MDRSLGEPLPHQQTNPTRARPKAINLSPFPGLCGISPGFPGLFPTIGPVPTRYSPVCHCPPPEGGISFDLHVLGLPPAFVLSQDQTLSLKERFRGGSLRLSLSGHLHGYNSRFSAPGIFGSLAHSTLERLLKRMFVPSSDRSVLARFIAGTPPFTLFGLVIHDIKERPCACGRHGAHPPISRTCVVRRHERGNWLL